MESKTSRTHRVGCMTTGLSMVAFGILFLLHMFIGLDYTFIFRLCPVILICVGVEMLIANLRNVEFKYDAGSVIIILCLMLFATCMAGADVCITELTKAGLANNIHLYLP